jgi:SAM-dependent methyltransferase
MRTEDFELLYKLEEQYWWFAAMRKIADAIVGEELKRGKLTILDAGCGTGYNIQHYEKQGHTVFALDVATAAIEGVHRRGFRRLCQASVVEIPYRAAAFDFVFSFDVLQQLSKEDCVSAIREMHRVLKPGGGLFVRVAALEWLRSSHDEELHTLHRFTQREIAESLKCEGFELRLASYANSFLFPVVLARRLLKRVGVGGGTDVKPLPKGLGWIDPIFRGLLSAEAPVLAAGRKLPIGLSVVCYARKA